MENGNSLFGLPTPKQSYKPMYPSKWWAITVWLQLYRTHAQGLPSSSLVSSSPSQVSLPFYPSLPPSSTSTQNTTSFDPVSPALTEIPFQLTPLLQTPYNSQPYSSKLKIFYTCYSTPPAPVIQTVIAIFLIPTSWSGPQHTVPIFSTQAFCGFTCSISI